MSGRQDLNLRPSAPKADALPDCATPRIDYFQDSKVKDIIACCQCFVWLFILVSFKSFLQKFFQLSFSIFMLILGANSFFRSAVM
jgi:hypothetical protein